MFYFTLLKWQRIAFVVLRCRDRVQGQTNLFLFSASSFSFRWNSKCLNTILQHYSVPWEHYSGGWLAALGSFCGGAAVCLVYPWFWKSPTWLGSLGSYINALMFSDVAQSSIPCVIVCPPTPFSQPGMYWIVVDGAGLYLNQNFTRFFYSPCPKYISKLKG